LILRTPRFIQYLNRRPQNSILKLELSFHRSTHKRKEEKKKERKKKHGSDSQVKCVVADALFATWQKA